MSKAKIQIDLKPVSKQAPKEGTYSSYYVDIYFNGECFRAICSYDSAMDMQKAGLIKQTQGQKHDDEGNLVYFDYPDKLDGAGVQFTSAIFEKTNN